VHNNGNRRNNGFVAVTQQCKQAVIEFHSNETVVFGTSTEIGSVGSRDRSNTDVLVYRKL
jgi:hypothetical protein